MAVKACSLNEAYVAQAALEAVAVWFVVACGWQRHEFRSFDTKANLPCNEHERMLSLTQPREAQHEHRIMRHLATSPDKPDSSTRSKDIRPPKKLTQCSATSPKKPCSYSARTNKGWGGVSGVARTSRISQLPSQSSTNNYAPYNRA